MHVAAWSFVMLNSGVTCNTNFKTCCFMMSPRVRLAVDRSREREEVTWWGSTSCKWIFLLPRALEEASDASPCGKGHSHFKKDPKNLHLSFNFYTHLFSRQVPSLLPSSSSHKCNALLVQIPMEIALVHIFLKNRFPDPHWTLDAF